MGKTLLIAASAVVLMGAAEPTTAPEQLEAKIFTGIGGHNPDLTSIQVQRGHAAAQYCAEITSANGGKLSHAMACAAGFLRGVNWQIGGDEQ